MPPQGACRAQAAARAGGADAILPSPLSPTLRAQAEELLASLPPAARPVLQRTRGVWFARSIDRAAATFLTCDIAEDRASGGFVLLSANDFPFERPVRDAEVPSLYWRALAGNPITMLGAGDPLRRKRESVRIRPRDHALRYLVLHELGHALSLYAGELSLNYRQRFQVIDERGFVGYSWALVVSGRRASRGGAEDARVGAVVPRHGIDRMAWSDALDVQGIDADLFVPGYARARAVVSSAAGTRSVCAVPARLIRAGFVTPTAARYPTEDFAEMFVHAMLASEGKLRSSDRIQIRLPGCGVEEIPSPYFSPGVAEKRAYIERAIAGRRHSSETP